MKSLNNLPDSLLIDQYMNGNSLAFTTLVLRYKDKLYTSIFLLVNDKFLAEDIFQEVFIRVINAINNKRYNEEGMFLAWAIRIAHNLCMDHLRKVTRSPQIKSSDDLDIMEISDAIMPGADYKMINDQRTKRIIQMIGMLPEDQQEIIILRHYTDLSFKEIARVMNISINTALGRMRYALKNLRKFIDEKERVL